VPFFTKSPLVNGQTRLLDSSAARRGVQSSLLPIFFPSTIDFVRVLIRPYYTSHYITLSGLFKQVFLVPPPSSLISSLHSELQISQHRSDNQKRSAKNSRRGPRNTAGVKREEFLFLIQYSSFRASLPFSPCTLTLPCVLALLPSLPHSPSLFRRHPQNYLRATIYERGRLY
jgi:hypothetical protein